MLFSYWVSVLSWLETTLLVRMCFTCAGPVEVIKASAASWVEERKSLETRSFRKLMLAQAISVYSICTIRCFSCLEEHSITRVSSLIFVWWSGTHGESLSENPFSCFESQWGLPWEPFRAAFESLLCWWQKLLFSESHSTGGNLKGIQFKIGVLYGHHLRFLLVGEMSQVKATYYFGHWSAFIYCTLFTLGANYFCIAMAQIIFWSLTLTRASQWFTLVWLHSACVKYSS